MNSGFDPYREWLGVTGEHRPPNHYELLGIRDFEDRDQVIDEASIKRIELLQDIATGSEQVEISQRILNEVSAARLCLMDRNTRDRYDLALRKKNLGMGSAEENLTRLGGKTRHADAKQRRNPSAGLTKNEAQIPDGPPIEPVVPAVARPPVKRASRKKKANSNMVLAVAALILLFSMVIAVLAVAVIFVS